MVAKLTGARSTIRKLKALPEMSNEAAVEVLTEWAEDVRDTATDLVPVDTSYLYNHISYFVREGERFARVGVFDSEAYYAQFVEYGTSSMAEQPFLRPAWRKHRRMPPKAYRKALMKRARSS